MEPQVETLPTPVRRQEAPREFSSSAETADDGVDLIDIIAAIRQGKWLIVLVSLVFVGGSLAFALRQPNVYKSEVLLAPAAAEDKGGLTGIAGQFGGLATLAGLNLGGSGMDKTTMAIEVLKSRAFVTDFIRRHELQVPLIAALGWSVESGTWILDQEVYDSKSGQWVRKVKPRKSSAPSDWEVYAAFQQWFSVSQDKKIGTVRIGVESFSPLAAQQWTTWLVEDINHHMRQADIVDAEKSITYLKHELNKTSNVGMQQVFYQLIEQQTKVVMLAQVRDQYAFKIIDPPVIPEEKVRPKRALIVVFGSLMGILLSTVIVLIRYFSKKG